MIKIFAIFALIIILAMPATAANVTKVEIHGVVFDTNSSTYNTTLQWDAQNFTGFWYSAGSHKSSETLKIVNQAASSLTAGSRVIQQENLLYNTSRTDQKYKVFSEKSRNVENGLTSTLTKTTSGGYYARLGWFGDLYVAVNGKSNKLAKLIKEQDKLEKQTLKLGTSWNLGEGFNLTVESLDTTTSPRQAWLSFSKDGKILDNKVVNQGEVYTYVVKNLNGESDVPIFVTYVDSIFTGAEGTATFVQLRYTWLISQNVLEIKAGDKFGVFEVKEANENYVLLYNKDKTISLDQNTVQALYGDLKFKVADDSKALRFYPIFEHTIQAEKTVELKAASATATATTAPAATQTVAATQAPAPVQASAATAAQTPAAAPVKTESSPLREILGFWGFYAIIGLVTAAYFALRKKD